MTFSRGGDPIRKTLALPALVEQAVRGAVLNTNVLADFSFESDLPTVEADENQIVQVLHSLAVNAVQAMPGGGTLRVRVARARARHDADSGLPASSDHVEISLRDAGGGIAPEHLAKIFDPFFTTRSGGSGLGLAIAYSIIKKHDGVIDVESQLGVGSTFSIHLPVSQIIPPSDRLRPAADSAEGQRVLFMDDDPDIRDLGGAILGLIGYDATLTREGSEAVAVYQGAMEAGRPFAAVILDLTIPGGMGGKETLRRLKEINPAVRAIVSSGYSNDAVIADFRGSGFVAMVAKPYRMEDLARALNEAIIEPPAV